MALSPLYGKASHSAASDDGLEVHVLDSGELSVTIHEEGRLGLNFGAHPLPHPYLQLPAPWHKISTCILHGSCRNAS